MKKVFGNNPTHTPNGFNSLEDAVLALSEDAKELLTFVANLQESGRLDELRGVVVHYEKSESRPFEVVTIKELENSGLVSFHPDSENGKAYMFLNSDIVKILQDLGDYIPCC